MKACVTKALNETALRGMFTSVFSGDEAAAQAEARRADDEVRGSRWRLTGSAAGATP